MDYEIIIRIKTLIGITSHSFPDRLGQAHQKKGGQTPENKKSNKHHSSYI
jgi:hypothetical protein